MSKENIPTNENKAKGSFMERSEAYFIENKKSLSIIGGVIVFLIASFVAYNKFYKEPLDLEAKELMWKAEYYFEVDSFNLAINGDAEHMGFAAIAENYSGTEAADLANYYLGISYLNIGEYEAAITALENSNLDDEILSTLAIGSAGDAYVELNQIDEGLAKYNEAIANSDNEFTTPIYLKKAAMLYEVKGDFEKATANYQRIFDDYEGSSQAIDIEKYIYRAKNSVAAK